LTFAAAARALGATAFREAAREALPVYGGLVLVAGVLFGGNGMSPSVFVRATRHDVAFEALVWAVWLGVTAAPLAPLVSAPSALWLRSFPVARWQWVAITAAMLALFEAPWALLFGLGGGAVAGIGRGVAALAAHALIFCRRSVVRDGLGAVAIAGGVVALRGGLGGVALPVLVVLGVLLVDRALREAPEPRAVVASFPLRAPAVVALALAEALGVVRAARPTLLRAALLVALATAATVVVLANRDPRDGGAVPIGGALLATSGALAASALAGPVLEAERAAPWLLAPAPMTLRAQRAAAALAVALVLAPLLAVGALLVTPRLLGYALVDAAALAALATAAQRGVHRRAPKDDGNGPLLVALGLAAVTVALVAGGGSYGHAVLVALGAVGLAVR
jgi:hypothetical protein